MVNVYGKSFLDRLAYHDKNSSPYQGKNYKESSSENNKTVDDRNCKFSHVGYVEPREIGKETINSSGIPDPFISNRSTKSLQSPRKRIIWNSKVINQINCTLQENNVNSLRSSSKSEQESINNSIEEVHYSREIYISPHKKIGIEKNENFSEFHYNYKDNQSSFQRPVYTEENLQKTYIESTKRHFNASQDEQFRKPMDLEMKTFKNNANEPPLTNYKVKRQTLYYDKILNDIRHRTIGSEDWIKFNQPKVALLGDSHTRLLADIIMEMLPGFVVDATVKPGAKSQRVLSSLPEILQNVTENDFIVIISGTNDMWSESLEEAKRVMYDAVHYWTSANMILCNVPNNYLEPINSPVQDNISNFNQFYADLVKFSTGVHLVNLYQLKDRNLFTRHGLHFNYNGKIRICEKVSHKILDILGTINA